MHRSADPRFLGASSSNSSPVAYPGLHSGGINLTRVVYLPGSEFVALALRPDPFDVQFLCMAISRVHPFGYALPGTPCRGLGILIRQSAIPFPESLIRHCSAVVVGNCQTTTWRSSRRPSIDLRCCGPEARSRAIIRRSSATVAVGRTCFCCGGNGRRCAF